MYGVNPPPTHHFPPTVLSVTLPLYLTAPVNKISSNVLKMGVNERKMFWKVSSASPEPCKAF